MTQYLTATYRDGQLVPDTPIDLDEGQRVYIAMAPDPQSVRALDLRSEEAEWWDPAQIEARVARLQAIEPMQMTDAEIAEWEAALADVRRVTLEAVRKEMGLP